MKPTRKQIAWGSAFTALAATGLGVGGLMAGGDSSSSAPPSSPAGTVSPLTGKPGTAGRVLVVKIDNVEAARPATGLNRAAIVYVIRVEGGLSRLAAVFEQDTMPPIVGPVRSARETDITLFAQYGSPAFAFSGAQSKLLPELRSSDLALVGSGYYRSTTRQAPHNEYLRTRFAQGIGSPVGDVGLAFSHKLQPGGHPGLEATAKFPAAAFRFAWNGIQYRVQMDGSATHYTTDNVIIQHTAISESRFRSRTGFVPYTHTTGAGVATVYRQGRAHDCRWVRNSAFEGTKFYQLDGQEMKLKPGRTWIVFN